jgi:hypothetical protein
VIPVGAFKLVVEIIETLRSKNLRYEAAWTDSFCHRRCEHEHPTLKEAVECAAPHGAGWYIIATENGVSRQLDGLEEEVVNKFRFRR